MWPVALTRRALVYDAHHLRARENEQLVALLHTVSRVIDAHVPDKRLDDCHGCGRACCTADGFHQPADQQGAVRVAGLHQIVCHTQVMWGTLVMWRTHLAVNKISVGGLAANEYALEWVPLC
jgi:hypothetical protein